MSSQKPLNAPSRAPVLRLEGVSAILDQKLESEPMILSALVVAATKGGETSAIWERLHAAAARDERLAELRSAYEQLLGATKLKLLTATVQADVLTHAAIFFDDHLRDRSVALEFLRRALLAAPTHEGAFAQLEAILMSADDMPALIELYTTAAAQRSANRDEQLSLLTRAAELADCSPSDTELSIKVYQQIVRLDPGNGAAIEALETYYLRDGRSRDAAKWF